MKTMKETFNPYKVGRCCYGSEPGPVGFVHLGVSCIILAGAFSNILSIMLSQKGCCFARVISIFILELKVIEYGPEVFSWVIKSIFLADGYGWIVKS